MATIGPFNLGGGQTGTAQSAAVFFFAEPAPKSFDHRSPRGDWVVEVREGLRPVIARCERALDFQSAAIFGRKQVLQALDLGHSRGQGLGTLDNGEGFLAYYERDQYPVVRHFSGIQASFEVRATVEIRGPDGKQVVAPKEERKASWHRALRYVRHAYETRDVYECYRNIYLAFEALLHHHCPKRKGEREGRWLERALTECEDMLEVDGPALHRRRYAPPEVKGRFYEFMRSATFHSKEGRAEEDGPAASLALPDELEATTLGEDLLLIVDRLFHAACRRHIVSQLQVSGRLFDGLFDGSFPSDIEIHTLPTPIKLDSDSEMLLSDLGDGSPLVLVCRETRPEELRGHVLAERPGSTQAMSEPVRSWVVSRANRPLIWSLLPEPLHLAPQEGFEIEIGLSYARPGLPPALSRPWARFW